MKKHKTSRHRLSRLKRNEKLAGYLFLIPAAICLLIWTIYPILNSFWYSLTDFNILNEKDFIGLENYKMLLEDEDWIFSIQRTFIYVLLFVPLMYIISLAAAELVKHLKILSGFFRTSFFLPVVVSAVAAGAIFRLILNTKIRFCFLWERIRSIFLEMQEMRLLHA